MLTRRGGRWHKATVMKRWFCDEAEAIAAGWRPARQR
jgi:hypothetical protein